MASRPDTHVLRQVLYKQMVGLRHQRSRAAVCGTGTCISCRSSSIPTRGRSTSCASRSSAGRCCTGSTSKTKRKVQRWAAWDPALGKSTMGPIRPRDRQTPPWSSGTKLPEVEPRPVKRSHASTCRPEDRKRMSSSPCPTKCSISPLPCGGRWNGRQPGRPDCVRVARARLLFQQGDGMPIARQALFEAMDVTSVLNGAELRQTKVWPQISAPFCILFATNRTPGVGAGFRFISPRIESSLNSAGGMRIDAVNAEVVPSRQLVDTPEILKILFRGSKADLGVVERIRGARTSNTGRLLAREDWSQ